MDQIDFSDPNKIINGNCPQLSLAIYNKSPILTIQRLLQAGADPNLQTNRGVSPVFFAAQENVGPELMSMLLQAGGDPNLQRENGASPVFIAACKNVGPQLMSLLLQAGGDPNLQKNDGFTPLLGAAELASIEILKLLLEAGGNPFHVSRNGSSILICASAGNKISNIEYLLKKYGPEFEKRSIGINYYDKLGQTLYNTAFTIDAGGAVSSEDSAFTVGAESCACGATTKFLKLIFRNRIDTRTPKEILEGHTIIHLGIVKGINQDILLRTQMFL